jgi:hypothetical protein
VAFEDRNGTRNNHELPWMIKMLHAAGDGSPEYTAEVIRWAEVAYWSEFRTLSFHWKNLRRKIKNHRKRMSAWNSLVQKLGVLTFKKAKEYLEKQKSEDLEWFSSFGAKALKALEDRRRQAKEDFLEHASCFSFTTVTQARHSNAKAEKQVKLFLIESDNPEMDGVARNKFDGGITVIRRSTGHTAILSKHSLHLYFGEVQEELERIEVNEGATWFMPDHGMKVLNGSISFTEVPPTGLSLQEVGDVIRRILAREEIVGVGMAFNAFEAALAEKGEKLELIEA